MHGVKLDARLSCKLHVKPDARLSCKLHVSRTSGLTPCIRADLISGRSNYMFMSVRTFLVPNLTFGTNLPKSNTKLLS